MTTDAMPKSFEAPLLGESSRAFAAFCVYRDMGPERSLAKTAEIVYGLPPGVPTTSPKLRQLKTWSAAYAWVSRAQAYDTYQALLRQRAADEEAVRFAAEEATQRERDRIRQRHLELELREQLYNRIQEMLRIPLLRKRTENGQTILEPVKWTHRDVVQYALALSKLGRLALDMATERPTVQEDQGDPNAAGDALDPAVLERLLERLAAGETTGA